MESEVLFNTVFGLVAYLCVSHIFFLFVINKLVNKVMSRNYFEYQQKPLSQTTTVKVDDSPQDYLGRVFS